VTAAFIPVVQIPNTTRWNGILTDRNNYSLTGNWTTISVRGLIRTTFSCAAAASICSGFYRNVNLNRRTHIIHLISKKISGCRLWTAYTMCKAPFAHIGSNWNFVVYDIDPVTPQASSFYKLLVVDSRGYSKKNYACETTECPGKRRKGLCCMTKSVMSVTLSKASCLLSFW